MWKGAAFAVLLLVPGGAQIRPGLPDEPPMLLKMNSRQIDRILKADHQRNLGEMAVLIRLSEELRDRWQPGEETERKLDEIGRLAERVRNRLRKF